MKGGDAMLKPDEGFPFVVIDGITNKYEHRECGDCLYSNVKGSKEPCYGCIHINDKSNRDYFERKQK